MNGERGGNDGIVVTPDAMDGGLVSDSEVDDDEEDDDSDRDWCDVLGADAFPSTFALVLDSVSFVMALTQGVPLAVEVHSVIYLTATCMQRDNKW